MVHRIEVRLKEALVDPQGQSVLAQIRELGIESVDRVATCRLFFLAGKLSADQAAQAGRELLSDPVIETFAPNSRNGQGDTAADAVIEVHLKPGVMDPVAASTERAIRDMGIDLAWVRPPAAMSCTARCPKNRARPSPAACWPTP